ncbi:hypothetical protein PoB_005453700 [Plakobranchus ocellatus]|uniref:Uncharacterized protein n=1 Tax=Plakobranchus ocellatus TaxID=259542 RepID=A0AAV4C924_9GAST|nr:hypothetical protein PoB_005453700 [Plakobranchus ocellatus]
MKNKEGPGTFLPALSLSPVPYLLSPAPAADRTVNRRIGHRTHERGHVCVRTMKPGEKGTGGALPVCENTGQTSSLFVPLLDLSHGTWTRPPTQERLNGRK